MDFKTYFTLDDFKALVDFNRSPTEYTQEWRKEHRDIMALHFHRPVKDFISALRDNQQLSKIQYAEGHQTNFSYLWNLFLENKEDKYGRNLYDFLDKTCFMEMRFSEDTPITFDAYVSGYEKLSNIITQGNFHNYVMPEDNCVCFGCAQRMKLFFKNWQPTYRQYEKDHEGKINYQSLIPPERCIPEQVVEINVNFPSGEILVVDWVRIDDLPKMVQPENQYDDKMSLNYIIGRINMTKHYADKYNFVSVSVGNNSPHVFQKGDDFIIGNYCYDDEKDEETPLEPEIKVLTQVITDFWGVTLIDKAQLIHLLAEKFQGDAKEMVDNYLETEFGGNILRIEPGDYVLHFYGSYNKFNDMCAEHTSVDKLFQLKKKVAMTPKLKP